jgi:hypothetical protein
VWEGFVFGREDKETSEDEGSEAGLNSKIVSLEKGDFDDEGGDRRRCRGRQLGHHREFIVDSFSCWSGSPSIGIGIASDKKEAGNRGNRPLFCC